MEVEVFGDLLFLVNLSMDYLTLYLVSRLCFRPLLAMRALAAAALGAIYAVASLFFPPLPTVLSVGIDLAVCLVLCRIGLLRRGERWWVLLRLGAVYLLISALLGGLLMLLSDRLGSLLSTDELRDAVGEENVTFLLFSLLAPAAVGVCLVICRAHRRAAAMRTVLLRLSEGERSIVLPALVDSGNLLREPLSGRPVIPVDQRCLLPLLPSELGEVLRSPCPTAALTTLPPALARRCRPISAGGALGSGMLICIAPEQLELSVDGKDGRAVVAYLAPVTLPDPHADYAAILPAALLTA